LTGKNVIVTGANTGIGKETARVLALANANVYMACRDDAKCSEAAEELKKLTGKTSLIHTMKLDLGSFASIKDFAKSWNALKLPLHLLINNAGVMACPPTQTSDGFELQYGVNHLGHFLLTNLLLDSIKKGAPSRVINVSSAAHQQGPVYLDVAGSLDIYKKSINFLQGGDWAAYAQSKTANILFTVELQRRFQQAGAKVTVLAVHPGVVKTDLGRHTNWVLMKVLSWFSKTPATGSSTTVTAAVSPALEGVGGKYLADCQIADAKPYAIDPEVAKKLWDLSAQQCKLDEALKEVTGKSSL